MDKEFESAFGLEFESTDECLKAFLKINDVVHDEVYDDISSELQFYITDDHLGIRFNIGDEFSDKGYIIYYTMKGNHIKIQILKDVYEDEFDREMENKPLIDIESDGMVLTSYSSNRK